MIYIYFFCLCAAILVQLASTSHFTRQWALHIEGGREVADQVARDHGFDNLGEIFKDHWHFSHRGIAKRSVDPYTSKKIQLHADTRVKWAKQQQARRRIKRDYVLEDSDPRWPAMWYLNRGPGFDMNVIPAWKEGITGKGAVVTILDDGLEKDHPDLCRNYDPLASYDVNNQDSDPSPRYDMIDSNRHGTRCAGEVAATSNNSVCALGVAHGAHVGGVRMLDGDVTDAVEARSLSLNPQHIDIYSASWGPDDDGKTVDGPGELATRAFIEGVTKGRNGKGSIFVWASGNGGRDHDNCNCDGYTNSIYSLSISSATEKGHVPWYSEACSSTLASTYSSGAVGERQVVTTDLHHSCTSSHTGTSASAPLAAGICALALEANPGLTWRDMQHIVVRTARPQRLVSYDWQTNGVGRNVSHSFGYGLMDAYAMVQLARRWITVPEQHKCEIPAPHLDRTIPAKSVVVLHLQVNQCDGVKVLEHVQAKMTISSHKRGDLNIQLISPMGTRVTLLAHRIHDISRGGFNHWPFMSVHSWGENPIGVWQLEIHNDGRLLGRATLQNWSLVLYGINQMNPNDVDPTKTNKIKSNSSNKKKNKKVKMKNAFKTTTTTTFVTPGTTVTVVPAKNQKLVKSKSKSTVVPKFFTPFNKNKKIVKPLPDFSPFYYAVNNSKLNKFPKKNYSITYPIMIPARDFEKSRDDFHRIQKQKEKSRDLNSNRNSKIYTPKPTFTQTEHIFTTTSTAVIKDITASVKAWDLVLYGTSTPPAIDLKKDYPHSSFSNNNNNNNEDFDDNSIDTDSPSGSLKSPQPEIRKDTTIIEEEYAQVNSLNGCKTSRGNVCIGSLIAITIYYSYCNNLHVAISLLLTFPINFLITATSKRLRTKRYKLFSQDVHSIITFTNRFVSNARRNLQRFVLHNYHRTISFRENSDNNIRLLLRSSGDDNKTIVSTVSNILNAISNNCRSAITCDIFFKLKVGRFINPSNNINDNDSRQSSAIIKKQREMAEIRVAEREIKVL